MPALTTYPIEEAKVDMLLLSPMIEIGVNH